MKIKEISVSYSEAINTGNFENVKWNITKVAELQEGDDAEQCKEELTNSVYSDMQKLVKFTKLKKIALSSMADKKGKITKAPIYVEDLEKANREMENKY
jgi:hypothetical protein